MKPLLTAFAVCALLAPVPLHAQETETVTRSIAMPANGTLELKTFSGRVLVTPTDGQQLTVTAVRRGSRYQLDHISLDVRAAGSTVYVDANHRRHDDWWRDNVVENDLEVHVPKGTNLHITSFSALVELDGVDAADIRTHTFSGKVDVHLARWNARERIDVHTFSGSVSLRLPDSASAHVEFDSFSGRLDSDAPLTLHTSSHRKLSAELGDGHGEGDIRVHTFSGGVKILR
jgi:DUF4097 and DUF4098 domain-containing protein YvlB